MLLRSNFKLQNKVKIQSIQKIPKNLYVVDFFNTNLYVTSVFAIDARIVLETQSKVRNSKTLRFDLGVFDFSSNRQNQDMGLVEILVGSSTTLVWWSLVTGGGQIWRFRVSKPYF